MHTTRRGRSWLLPKIQFPLLLVLLGLLAAAVQHTRIRPIRFRVLRFMKVRTWIGFRDVSEIFPRVLGSFGTAMRLDRSRER